MNRCLPFVYRATAACALAVSTLLMWPGAANAQVQNGLGVERNFPESALRGQLVVSSTSVVSLNGRAIQVAPGMRLFSPQNSLVLLHTVLGQAFTVNYQIEPTTGMLLTAWVLTQGEAAKPGKGPNASGVIVNYTTDSASSSKTTTTK